MVKNVILFVIIQFNFLAILIKFSSAVLKKEIGGTLSINSNCAFILTILYGCETHFILWIERNAGKKNLIVGSLLLFVKDILGSRLL